MKRSAYAYPNMKTKGKTTVKVYKKVMSKASMSPKKAHLVKSPRKFEAVEMMKTQYVQGSSKLKSSKSSEHLFSTLE